MRYTTGTLVVLLLALVALVAPALAYDNNQSPLPDKPIELSELPISEKIFKLGKAAITGELPQEMIEKRARADKEYGLVRLNDSTYDDLVLYGDPNILWIILVSDDKSDMGIGRLLVEAFLNATKLFKEKHASSGLGVEATGRRVVWARLDYLSEWKTCTRLNIYKPPKVAFISDRGATLRFISPRTTNSQGEQWVKWIIQGAWQEIPVYESRFSPNGDRKYLIEYYIRFFELITPYTSRIPGILWLFIPGMFSQLFVGWLHSRRAESKVKEQTATGPDGKPVPVVKKPLPLGTAVERVRNARLQAEAQKRAAQAAAEAAEAAGAETKKDQ